LLEAGLRAEYFGLELPDFRFLAPLGAGGGKLKRKIEVTRKGQSLI